MATDTLPSSTLQTPWVNTWPGKASPVLIEGPPESNPIPDNELESYRTFAEMQKWFKEGIGSPLYQHVAVLLITWKKELDDLKCADEVQRLEKLFRDSFRYFSQIFELDDQSKCDLQLQTCINTFIQMHDKPGSLIIVYYSGHGSHRESEGNLILHAKKSITGYMVRPRNNYPTQAVWEDAEISLIKHTKCDVLSILDCCFAGDVHKGSDVYDDRTYQLISAGGKQRITQKPGPNSFTQALIDSLTDLLKDRGDKPFTTIQLVERIKQKESRRKNPPCLWHRLHRDDREILLGPLAENLEQNQPTTITPSRAFLTVRLALGNDVDLREEQIMTLGKEMMQAGKNSRLPIQRLDLVSYSKSARKRTLLQLTGGIIAAVRFQQSVKSRVSPRDEAVRENEFPVMPNSDASVPAAQPQLPTQIGAVFPQTTQTTSPLKSRKRGRSPVSDAAEVGGQTRFKGDDT